MVPVAISDTSAAAVRFGTYLAKTMGMDMTILHLFDAVFGASQTISDRVRELEWVRLTD